MYGGFAHTGDCARKAIRKWRDLRAEEARQRFAVEAERDHLRRSLAHIADAKRARPATLRGLARAALANVKNQKGGRDA